MKESLEKLVAEAEAEFKANPTPFLSVARGALHLALNNITEHLKAPKPAEAAPSSPTSPAPEAA